MSISGIIFIGLVILCFAIALNDDGSNPPPRWY